MSNIATNILPRAFDRVRWHDSVLSMLKLRVLLPESYINLQQLLSSTKLRFGRTLLLHAQRQS
jgi:hypothetical protein